MYSDAKHSVGDGCRSLLCSSTLGWSWLTGNRINRNFGGVRPSGSISALSIVRSLSVNPPFAKGGRGDLKPVQVHNTLDSRGKISP